MEITTVGLHIAKRVFQLHGVDAAGKAVLRRKLQRSEVLGFFKALPTCLVGIEACGTAHYWAADRSPGSPSRQKTSRPCSDDPSRALLASLRLNHFRF
jgi:transposase